MVTVKILRRYSGDAGLARNLSKVNSKWSEVKVAHRPSQTSQNTLYYGHQRNPKSLNSQKSQKTKKSSFSLFDIFEKLKKLSF